MNWEENNLSYLNLWFFNENWKGNWIILLNEYIIIVFKILNKIK